MYLHNAPTQNLGEAEYAVALFMYMRLQGYPPERIAILTTYNGQKHLIRDVLNKRCANSPVFGLPEKVCMHVYVFVCVHRGGRPNPASLDIARYIFLTKHSFIIIQLVIVYM